MRRIFVGNVGYHTSKDELRELFAAYGPVKRVDIATNYAGRSRGFAFVIMMSAEDTDNAISALDGAKFRGRTLTVGVAHPRPELGKSSVVSYR